MAVRTKQAIRQAFIELLNERPLDKISVKDIAERSTVRRWRCSKGGRMTKDLTIKK